MKMTLAACSVAMALVATLVSGCLTACAPDSTASTSGKSSAAATANTISASTVKMRFETDLYSYVSKQKNVDPGSTRYNINKTVGTGENTEYYGTYSTYDKYGKLVKPSQTFSWRYNHKGTDGQGFF